MNELVTVKIYWHERMHNQYAAYNQGGGLASYDNPRGICDKIEYANERSLNGCKCFV